MTGSRTSISAVLMLLMSVITVYAAFVSFAINGPPIGYVGPFQGNPNVSISSITPSITCAQSGTLYTPAFIQCSGSPTTASGTSDPYSDLEFTWNFGDPNGTETYTHPVSGSTVNANSKQWGPEATYVWRNAGTYTVTMKVRGCTNGHSTTPYAGGGGACNNGTYTIATATQSVTVSTFTASGGDYYFNTATGNDSNPCSLASPCASTTKANTLLETGS